MRLSEAQKRAIFSDVKLLFEPMMFGTGFIDSWTIFIFLGKRKIFYHQCNPMHIIVVYENEKIFHIINAWIYKTLILETVYEGDYDNVKDSQRVCIGLEA